MQKDNLNLFLKHNNHKCRYCQEQFRYKVNLTNHITKKHKSALDELIEVKITEGGNE